MLRKTRRVNVLLPFDFIRLLIVLLALVGLATAAESEDSGRLDFKEVQLRRLVEQVPKILSTYDAETGRFGTGIWICGDQQSMYPLAVAFSSQSDTNPYGGSQELLEVIMKAGDALIEDMDDQGQWMFRKKDGSTWGMIWMPWTYSRWVRTFGLVRDKMPEDRRLAWAEALTLGYTGISKTQLGHVHNIPTHHAMGLYAAGKVLDRPEWCEQAAEFMVKVIESQSAAGYWSEGGGPVVAYNFVYVDAVGTYYAMSGDRRALPALDRASAFHRHFTYPGGQNVETIDQRNPYHERINAGNVGFTFSPVGRAYLKNQWSQMDNALDADLISSLLLYGEEGGTADQASSTEADLFVLSDGQADRAAMWHDGSWFVCLSAYTAPVSTSRWSQDRQNLVSIYHDRVGLILGGGNTKLQPAWSNFTVGDLSQLVHQPGDTHPNFLPQGPLVHVPSSATLVREPLAGLDLVYGKETCCIRVEPVDERTVALKLEATLSSGMTVLAHLTLLPHLGQPLVTAAGQELVIGTQAVELTAEQVGGAISYAGYQLKLPGSASLHWPALPHNPYRRDGRSVPEEGRIVVRIPFDQQHLQHTISLTVPSPADPK